MERKRTTENISGAIKWKIENENMIFKILKESFIIGGNIGLVWLMNDLRSLNYLLYYQHIGNVDHFNARMLILI